MSRAKGKKKGYKFVWLTLILGGLYALGSNDTPQSVPPQPVTHQPAETKIRPEAPSPHENASFAKQLLETKKKRSENSSSFPP
ncbi:MAG: hypothetical protein ACR2OJ_12585 [Hyphomicrobiales bacterium]